MNITHLCLAGMITDGWTYQENLLISYHIKMGNNVSVITSQWVYEAGNKLVKTKNNNYVSPEGAHYIRLPIKNRDKINNRFKRYTGIIEALDIAKPDILFVHGLQFLDISVIAKYIKEHSKIRLYIDNHSDFSNSGKNWISKNVLHGIIWKHYAQLIEPYTYKFYGVLPARVDFLKYVYGLPNEKCELLVMGADDEKVEEAAQPEIRRSIREKYGILEDDFLVMTGGKIDKWKTQTLLLMKAIQNINKENVKLIVFGSVTQELQEQVQQLVDGKKVQYIGWIQSKDSYKYYGAADLVVFPGRHSVFWEQVTGQGIPMIVKDWPGTHHVDLGGNVKFLKEDSAKEIQGEIEHLLNNPDEYKRMKQVAMEKGMQMFSYKNIAKRALS